MTIVTRDTCRILAAALGAAVALAAGGASAFHPGDTKSGDVPQGPEWIACGNPGWSGIEVAIAVDGTVHCLPDSGEGGDTGDGNGEDGGGDGGGVG